ncbi:hypothetical protein N7456_006646 [Penicillium angulare]|uniref:Uncharacterized protein n=1 Tax=Penicillium angulare TaxID=116970 RepID=A0A9W9FI66_9EURO|nr:hypothetical protein N7456_006646 [Penicillium angulare]
MSLVESTVDATFRGALSGLGVGTGQKEQRVAEVHKKVALRGEVQDLEGWQAVDSSGGDAARDR